jgi:hypothetical protein
MAPSLYITEMPGAVRSIILESISGDAGRKQAT